MRGVILKFTNHQTFLLVVYILFICLWFTTAWFEGWCQQGWWEVDGPTEEGYCLSVLGEPGEFTPSYILIWYLAWLYMYHIARNFCGRKLSQIGDYKIFTEKTFADCSLVPPKDVTPQNFAEITFTNSHKTLKFVQVFFLKSFPLYSCKYKLCA